jgi:hypothetical protein
MGISFVQCSIVAVHNRAIQGFCQALLAVFFEKKSGRLEQFVEIERLAIIGN